MPFEPRATSFSMANAQLLAQAAAVAYSDPSRCEKWATVSGFTGPFDFFDNGDTQGFVAEGSDAVIVAFRGTQPNQPMDWFVDFRATRGHWDHNIGEVHELPQAVAEALIATGAAEAVPDATVSLDQAAQSAETSDE